MTAREMGFIKAAARGLRLARKQLAGDPVRAVALAMESMANPLPDPITNQEIAFYAAMLLAWEDMGKPDMFS